MATPKRPDPLLSENLVERALPFHLLQNILIYYVDLPCFLIRGDHWKTWNTLVTLRQRNTPIDYEDSRQWEARIRYNERVMRTAAKTGQAQCEELNGVSGLFVPLMKEGRCLGILQAGAFLTALPSAPELALQWKALRGHAPQPHEGEFLEYVRAITDTPILDAPLIEGLRQLLELFGAFLTRSLDAPTVSRRMEELLRGVFARRLWHRQWVEWQVIQRKFFRFNGDPKALMKWEVEELGIERFPTTAFAAKREGTGQEWSDQVAALAFQREALALAKEFEQTLAYPLQNYGVLFLSSAAPGLSRPRAAAAIRARAEEISKRLSRSLGCRVWMGLGQPGSAALGLHGSYQEAVVALHSAVARDQALVAYQDLDLRSTAASGLRQKVRTLVDALLEGGQASASRLRSLFVQDVLLQTRNRPEAARHTFLDTLNRLLEALESKKSIDPQDLAEAERRFTLQLEGAYNLNEMVGRFEANLELLLDLLERPAFGDKFLRLRKAQQALRDAPQSAWTLPKTARQFGFSPTAFSRDFSQFAGMPFSDYLLKLRLEKATQLLEEGDLPLAQVAEACGFSSLNYFMQIFRKKIGKSAGRYRQQSQA